MLIAVYGTADRCPRYAEALTRLRLPFRFFTRSDLPSCDALLLTGGGDIEPYRYGGNDPSACDLDPARDEAELSLFRQALHRRCRIFGICRGMQLINVALGGTLCSLPGGHRPESGHGDIFHAVRSSDPLLTGLYGERFTVNSHHHQAVARLGDGLCIAAAAADGTVEAVRHTELPILGVQWHPERLTPPEGDGLSLLHAWFSAAEITCSISTAAVTTPTPPGTGETAAATFDTASVSASPTSR